MDGQGWGREGRWWGGGDWGRPSLTHPAAGHVGAGHGLWGQHGGPVPSLTAVSGTVIHTAIGPGFVGLNAGWQQESGGGTACGPRVSRGGPSLLLYLDEPALGREAGRLHALPAALPGHPGVLKALWEWPDCQAPTPLVHTLTCRVATSPPEPPWV